PAEAPLAPPAAHRVPEPSEGPQLAPRPAPQRGDVREDDGVERIGGVELEQVEAGGAQVHALDGPVVQAGDAQRAAVAGAPGQDPPGVQRVVPVGPRGPGHGPVVVRLLLADAVGPPAGPQPRVPAAELLLQAHGATTPSPA